MIAVNSAEQLYIYPFKYALMLKITVDHNVRVCDVVLRQGADGRFWLDDPLVDQLLLQVSPSQAPQVVHLVYGALRQVIFIII